MFKFLKYFYLIIFIFSTNIVKSNETYIVYVDVQKLLSQSNAGKKAFKDLNQIINNKKKQFDKEEKKLQSEEAEILKQKNVVSEDELNNRIQKFRAKINDFQNKKKKFNEELSNKRLKATGELLKSVNQILSNYASENKISLIIQKKNIIVGQSSLDVTDTIMKILNKQIKSINLG
jgi:outer membrane protein|tara:strand:+ start:2005 stop:2532 length:528 start_codon:yes stop_codon:yes gene_type:complete